MEQISTRKMLVLLAVVLIASQAVVSARYLPTKRQGPGQEDRLDRLRDILRDLFENEQQLETQRYLAEHRGGVPMDLEAPVGGGGVGHLQYKRDTGAAGARLTV